MLDPDFDDRRCLRTARGVGNNDTLLIVVQSRGRIALAAPKRGRTLAQSCDCPSCASDMARIHPCYREAPQ